MFSPLNIYKNKNLQKIRFLATEVKSIPNFSARVAGLIWQQINGVTLSTKGPKGTLKIGPEPVQAQLQVNRVAFMQTFLYQEKPFLAKLARQYNVIKHMNKTGKSRSLGMKASGDEEGRLRNNGARGRELIRHKPPKYTGLLRVTLEG